MYIRVSGEGHTPQSDRPTKRLSRVADERYYCSMSIASDLLDILVCPKCKGELKYRTEPKEQLVCHACRLVYTVEDDIPIMLIDEADPL